MLIEEITLNGLLSFGPDSPPFPLRPLNVLIGPNGSGKSNLVEAIGFLRSSPGSFARSFRGTGGVREWFWKGRNNKDAILQARIPRPTKISPLQHAIHFTQRNERFEIKAEFIETGPATGHYSFANGIAELENAEGKSHTFAPEDIRSDASILSQIKDPVQYPALALLADQYGQVRIYRDWSFGRGSVFRIEASERTQLIVTPHSDILVDAMTEDPESVVVVEKHDRQTRMERLRNEGALREMLGKYRLGELWKSGEIRRKEVK